MAKIIEKRDYTSACSLEYPNHPIECDPIGYPKLVQKVVDGKIVSSIEFVIDDNDEQYQVNDFALENLLAAGVELKEMKFNSCSLINSDNVASMAAEVSALREKQNVES